MRVLRATNGSRREMGPVVRRLKGIAAPTDDTIPALGTGTLHHSRRRASSSGIMCQAGALARPWPRRLMTTPVAARRRRAVDRTTSSQAAGGQQPRIGPRHGWASRDGHPNDGRGLPRPPRHRPFGQWSRKVGHDERIVLDPRVSAVGPRPGFDGAQRSPLPTWPRPRHDHRRSQPERRRSAVRGPWCRCRGQEPARQRRSVAPDRRA